MIEKLQVAFKDIKYSDVKHQYFCNGKELTSVTRFLSSLKPEFNSIFWSTLKSYTYSGFNVKSIWNNYNSFRLINNDLSEELIFLDSNHDRLTVTPEEVRKQWSLDSMAGKAKGSYIHLYLENLENRITDIPKTEIPEGLSTGQAINYFNSLNVAKELCLNYVEWARENLVLVASEFSVGDLKLGLAGRFDRLYFNKSTKKYEIWDFKTDKQIRYKSNFGKLALFDLPDCEFVKYSLQCSLYRKIIEDALGVELGESNIVWFNLKENKWEIIQTTNYTSLINTNICRL